MDISKVILKLSPSDVFLYMSKDLFKELDNIDTEEVDWLAWDPDSLVVYLYKKDITINNPIALDKFMAIVAFLYRRDIGTTDAKAFEKLVHAFNNDVVVTDVIQEPTLEAVNYAVKEMHILNELLQKMMMGDKYKTSLRNELVFTGEVPNYVASVAYSNNFPILNSNLRFAKDILNFLNSNKWRDIEFNGFLTNLKELVDFLESNTLDSNTIDSIIKTAGDTSEIYKNLVIKYIGLILYNPCIIER